MTYNKLIHKVSPTPSQERNGAKTGDGDDVAVVMMMWRWCSCKRLRCVSVGARGAKVFVVAMK